jgi:polyhydroxyalkanoate synthesis repressor PhaR
MNRSRVLLTSANCLDRDGLLVRKNGIPMGNLRQINKYQNRRLYDKGESRYITLTGLYRLILAEVEFIVIDNETQQDITDRILLQVMSEQERSGTPMLGREFLLQTIRIYGSPLRSGIGECLRQSVNAFVLQSGGERRLRKGFETPLQP